MCLILFSYEQHPKYRLVLTANRDEFHDRPTAPMQFWEDDPDLLAGRDLRAGGTWMGLTRGGRFAAITNYREAPQERENVPSRGELVADFLRDDVPPHVFLDRLTPVADRYDGFNLLAADRSELAYFSNREGEVRLLAPGLYGLSNHLLDTPWPKVDRGKQALQNVLDAGDLEPEALLDLLDDRTCPPDEALPDTGMSPEWERALASMFINTPHYGTRSSTALLVGRDGSTTVTERTYGHDAGVSTRRFDLEMKVTDK